MFTPNNEVASSLFEGEYMKKLNKRKVRWIIKEMRKRELSAMQIATLQNVSVRWVRKLYQKYLICKEFPFPKKPGRKSKPIPSEIISLVEKTFKNIPLGAVKMEQLLDDQGIHIPHNTIHVILRQKNLAYKNQNKSKKRKYCRYERTHSNSLWHTDYCWIDGKQVIAIIDDASRFVIACNEYEQATANNATKTLIQGINNYGTPDQLLTDNGTHFLSTIRQSCPQPEQNIFQTTLKKYGIKHIKTRIHHPQTNGKIERWFGSIKKLKKHYGTIPQAVHAYNHNIHHLSLTNGHIRTPAQAYQEKKRDNK